MGGAHHRVDGPTVLGRGQSAAVVWGIRAARDSRAGTLASVDPATAHRVAPWRRNRAVTLRAVAGSTPANEAGQPAEDSSTRRISRPYASSFFAPTPLMPDISSSVDGALSAIDASVASLNTM